MILHEETANKGRIEKEPRCCLVQWAEVYNWSVLESNEVKSFGFVDFEWKKPQRMLGWILHNHWVLFLRCHLLVGIWSCSHSSCFPFWYCNFPLFFVLLSFDNNLTALTHFYTFLLDTKWQHLPIHHNKSVGLWWVHLLKSRWGEIICKRLIW